MSREQRDDELLAAYLDGVGELTPDERKRAEHADPAEATATRAMLDRLRALPDDPREPDWSAMERSIRLAVSEPPKRRWWMLAIPVAIGGAVIALGLAMHPIKGDPAIATLPPPSAAHAERAPAPLILDGEEIDLDAVDPSLLDAPDLVSDEGNLLPTDQWIDRLDDRALAHAEKILGKT